MHYVSMCPSKKITGGCEKASCKETVLNSDFPNLFDHMENICFFFKKQTLFYKKKYIEILL